MSVNEETVSTLPFFSLSDRDFNHFLGNWSVPDLNEAVDLFDLFPNPDKGDESDPDLMLSQKSQQRTPSVFDCKVFGRGHICNIVT